MVSVDLFMNAKFCFECISDVKIFCESHPSSLIFHAYNQQLDINTDSEAEKQQEYLMMNFSAHNSKYMDLIIT